MGYKLTLALIIFSFQLLVKGTVFARMSPDQKAQLVTSLMDIGYGNKVAYTCGLVSMLVILLYHLLCLYTGMEWLCVVMEPMIVE